MSSSDTDTPPTRALLLVLWLCAFVDPLSRPHLHGEGGRADPERTETTNSEIGDVNAAFTLAYGLFAVPVRALGRQGRPANRTCHDRPRLVDLHHPDRAAYSLLVLLIIRFLFAQRRQGAFRMQPRDLTLVPGRERGRVRNGARLRSDRRGHCSPGAAYLIEAVGWRWSFFAFGAISIVWAVGFWLWFRDDPADHRGVNAPNWAHSRIRAASHDRSGAGAVGCGGSQSRRDLPQPDHGAGRLFHLLLLLLVPEVPEDARGVTNIRAGWLTSLVMAGSGFGMLVGGWLGDRIPRGRR